MLTSAASGALRSRYPPLDHVKKRRSCPMAAIDSTALAGRLRAGHLAARPCAPRPSPMALGVVGLVQTAAPPGHAVGAWCGAGALGHSGPGGGILRCFNPLRTRMHRRALGLSSSGREMSRSSPSASRAGRASSWPAAPLAHRPLEGCLHCARRCRALRANPGALRAQLRLMCLSRASTSAAAADGQLGGKDMRETRSAS